MRTTEATLRVPLPQGTTHAPSPQFPATGGDMEGSWPAEVRADWNLGASQRSMREQDTRRYAQCLAVGAWANAIVAIVVEVVGPQLSAGGGGLVEGVFVGAEQLLVLLEVVAQLLVALVGRLAGSDCDGVVEGVFRGGHGGGRGQQRLQRRAAATIGRRRGGGMAGHAARTDMSDGMYTV